MANVHEPDADELREIGRRLCALIHETPNEPVTAAALQRLADADGPPAADDDERKRRAAVLYALCACADALGAAEDDVAAEIKELRGALEGWTEWVERGVERLNRLREAYQGAIPRLDEQADRREAELKAASTARERTRLSRGWSPDAYSDVIRSPF